VDCWQILVYETSLGASRLPPGYVSSNLKALYCAIAIDNPSRVSSTSAVNYADSVPRNLSEVFQGELELRCSLGEVVSASTTGVTDCDRENSVRVGHFDDSR